MAKKKAAKKGGLMGVLASVVIMVFAVISIVCLSAPILSVTSGVDTAIESTTSQTAFEFMKDMNEKDEDGKANIDYYKELDKEAKTKLDEAKAEVKKLEDKGLPVGAAKDALKYAQKAYDTYHSQVVWYNAILAVEVLAALSIVFALLGLVMYALKKGNIGFILNLIALLLLLGVFIAACIMTADANLIVKSMTNEDLKTVAKSVAPAAVLALSLIGTLVGGAFTVISKKK